MRLMSTKPGIEANLQLWNNLFARWWDPDLHHQTVNEVTFGATMKIAFSSTLHGGLNSYALEAGRWLSRNGHTVHVIYLGSDIPPKEERYEALNFHAAPYGNVHYYLARLGLSHTSIPLFVRMYEYSRAIAAVLKRIHPTDG